VPASFSDETTTRGLRLSFFDTELDALKRFDLEQRSDEMLRQAVIPPRMKSFRTRMNNSGCPK
jgi:transcription-repair coupling factor (superfamily II helicase)